MRANKEGLPIKNEIKNIEAWKLKLQDFLKNPGEPEDSDSYGETYFLRAESFDEFSFHVNTLLNERYIPIPNMAPDLIQARIDKLLKHEKAHADTASKHNSFDSYTIRFLKKDNKMIVVGATTTTTLAGSGKGTVEIALAPYYAGVEDSLFDLSDADYEQYLAGQFRHEVAEGHEGDSLIKSRE
jgi:hypothetical protein